jgi:hypothetical protein
MPRALLALLLLLLPAVAEAADKAACIQAAESGQRLRADGKLLLARAQFYTCAEASCPKVVQIDCARWAGEVDKGLPTVVLYATEGGRDVSEIEVKLDGEPWLARIDGKALPLDPGPHRLSFVHAGSEAELEVVIVEGEKNRKLVATFLPLAAPPPLSTTAPAAPAADPGVPAASWILGGVGLFGVAAFSALGLSGRSDLDALRKSCAPGCRDDQLQPVRNKLLAADLSLAAGVVSVAIAAWLFIDR